MSRMLLFRNSGIIMMFWEFLVLYYRMLSVSIDYKFSLSLGSWCWLLVGGRSKIQSFVGMMNLLALPKVICRGAFLLLELLSLFSLAEAENREVCTQKLAFMDSNLCLNLGGGLISLELFFLRRLVFYLTSCKHGMFCFTTSILEYFFFLYSYCLSYNVWPLLDNRHFYALSQEYFEVLYTLEQAPYFVLFWQWTKTWTYS